MRPSLDAPPLARPSAWLWGEGNGVQRRACSFAHSYTFVGGAHRRPHTPVGEQLADRSPSIRRVLTLDASLTCIQWPTERGAQDLYVHWPLALTRMVPLFCGVTFRTRTPKLVSNLRNFGLSDLSAGSVHRDGCTALYTNGTAGQPLV